MCCVWGSTAACPGRHDASCSLRGRAIYLPCVHEGRCCEHLAGLLAGCCRYACRMSTWRRISGGMRNFCTQSRVRQACWLGENCVPARSVLYSCARQPLVCLLADDRRRAMSAHGMQACWPAWQRARSHAPGRRGWITGLPACSIVSSCRLPCSTGRPVSWLLPSTSSGTWPLHLHATVPA